MENLKNAAKEIVEKTNDYFPIFFDRKICSSLLKNRDCGEFSISQLADAVMEELEEKYPHNIFYLRCHPGINDYESIFIDKDPESNTDDPLPLTPERIRSAIDSIVGKSADEVDSSFILERLRITHTLDKISDLYHKLNDRIQKLAAAHEQISYTIRFDDKAKPCLEITSFDEGLEGCPPILVSADVGINRILTENHEDYKILMDRFHAMVDKALYDAEESGDVIKITYNDLRGIDMHRCLWTDIQHLLDQYLKKFSSDAHCYTLKFHKSPRTSRFSWLEIIPRDKRKRLASHFVKLQENKKRVRQT